MLSLSSLCQKDRVTSMWRRCFLSVQSKGRLVTKRGLNLTRLYFSTLQTNESIYLGGEFSCTPKQVLQENI